MEHLRRKSSASLSYILLFVGVFITPSISLAQFVDAKPIERAPPAYPLVELTKTNDGLVEIIYMVGESGEIFEPVVVTSTSKAIEESALEAVSNYKYLPATINGEPVTSRQEIRIKFEVDRAPDAVSPEFGRAYRLAINEIKKDNPNLKKIAKRIGRMSRSRGLTFYAQARLNFIKLNLAIRKNNTDEILDASRKVLLFDRSIEDTDSRIFDAEMTESIEDTVFKSMVLSNRYSEAITLYDTWSKNYPKLAELHSDLVNKINNILNSDSPVIVDINFRDRKYSVEHLSKRAISLMDISGDVTELKFRCERKFAKFDFIDDQEYRIPKSWGPCTIEIRGDKGTTAKLVQY